MASKIPPPPFLTGEQQTIGGARVQQLSASDLQRLNRWLLEIQSIFNAGGLIDPDQIVGLPELFTQVGINTTNIAANTAAIAQNTIDIAANAGATTALTATVTALDARVAAVEARNQILNGNGAPAGGLGANGDLYIQNDGTPGSFLYGKIGGAWTAFA